MTEPALKILSDNVSAAHARIQKDFETINPVVGVNQGMRSAGIPADLMTIDCLKTNRRILLVLHDQQPDIVQYEYTQRDVDPSMVFQKISISEVTENKLYEWIRDYFSQP